MRACSEVACLLLVLGATSACARKAVSQLTNDKAPETFRVNLDTSRGPVVIEVNRADAPIGADRFYNLVRANSTTMAPVSSASFRVSSRSSASPPTPL
jgi:hypothetical protein